MRKAGPPMFIYLAADRGTVVPIRSLAWFGLLLLVAMAGSSVLAPSESSAAGGASPALHSVSFVDTTHGWVAGDGLILATMDGGTTWSSQYSGDETITALDFVSPSTGWAVGGDALLATTDGGANWQPVGEPPQPLEKVDFLTTSAGYGVGQGWLFSTVDGGASWRPVATPIPVGDACFTSTTQGWTANRMFSTGGNSPAWTPSGGTPSGGTVLFETDDAGQTWQQRSLPDDVTSEDQANVAAGNYSGGTGWGQKLRCIAPSVLWDLVLFDNYAGGEGYAVVQSTTGGQQSTEVLRNPGTTRPGPTPGDLFAVSATTAYLTGMCGACDPASAAQPSLQPALAIAQTTDGGQSWTNYPIPDLPLTANALSFPTADNGWLVAERASSGATAPSAVLATGDGGVTWTPQEILSGSAPAH